MSSRSSRPTSRMRRTYAAARSLVTKRDGQNSACISEYTFRLLGKANGRSELRSHRVATVRRPGARRDLRAVSDRPLPDLWHADRRQLRSLRLLHGWCLCRALYAIAWRKFLALSGRGTCSCRPVRPCRGTYSDQAALWTRYRLSAAADVRPKLCDGRICPHRFRQDRLSLRHARDSAGSRQHRRRLFSALPLFVIGATAVVLLGLW